MASRAPSLAHGKKAKINYEVPVLVGVRTPMNAKANAVRDRLDISILLDIYRAHQL
jgi:hypothetical protein